MCLKKKKMTSIHVHVCVGLRSVSRFLFSKWKCGDTPRLVVSVTALSRVNDEETLQSLPREARMVLKDHSDKEAVQSRK